MVIDRIAMEVGLDRDAIVKIVRSASRRYKTYTIPKRNGDLREINHPTPEVKFLQRWVVRNVLSSLPVHHAVMSYRDGVGIRKNAENHVHQRFLLKLDFQNFFPSITRADVEALLRTNIKAGRLADLSMIDVSVIGAIVCRKGVLTIGAPSSPSISNAILWEFDGIVFDECVRSDVVYTRYADDLVFSADEPGVLASIYQFVADLVESRKNPRLSLNAEKIVFSSKKRRRTITGLNLTSDGKISIGREKKREIKSLCFKFGRAELLPTEISYLQGYLSFVSAVEPTFLSSLQSKYGDQLVQAIFERPLISKKSNK